MGLETEWVFCYTTRTQKAWGDRASKESKYRLLIIKYILQPLKGGKRVSFVLLTFVLLFFQQHIRVRVHGLLFTTPCFYWSAHNWNDWENSRGTCGTEKEIPNLDDSLNYCYVNRKGKWQKKSFNCRINWQTLKNS